MLQAGASDFDKSRGIGYFDPGIQSRDQLRASLLNLLHLCPDIYRIDKFCRVFRHIGLYHLQRLIIFRPAVLSENTEPHVLCGAFKFSVSVLNDMDPFIKI